VRWWFRGLGVAISAGALLIGGAEILLQVRSAMRQRAPVADTPLRRLDLAYRPCTHQYPHPHYMFFFPLDPRDRVALGNDVCSLDADGFREPGPRHAGTRKLAFLLGGSAAFGHYATSNDQTITSHLNRLQDEYFLVNGGVPSWNSTQQLMRLALDIVERRPALVIAYDGANDAVLAGQVRARTGAPYPPGTPEFFDVLEGLIDEDAEPLSERWHPRRVFPELSLRLDQWRGRAQPDNDDDVATDEDIVAAARRYRANHARMAELSTAAGARFVAVFQPVANLHARVDTAEIGRRPLMEKFHREAMRDDTAPHATVDFSAVFDAVVDRIDLVGPNLDDAAMFVDLVHLTDRGNALVAQRLWQALAAPGSSALPQR
jgi:lysophospholipase L1-like esterase